MSKVIFEIFFGTMQGF